MLLVPRTSICFTIVVSGSVKITSSHPIVAKSGDNVTITCNATGYPLPQITWSYQREKNTIAVSISQRIIDHVFSRESSIEIRNVTAAEDRGTYICAANNSVGTSKANITVKGKTKVVLRMPVSVFFALDRTYSILNAISAILAA